MSQSKLSSLIESLLNVGSGFVVSSLLWSFVIVPVYEIEVTVTQNLEITAIFTVISVIRGYIWRRVFNRFNKFAQSLQNNT